MPTNPEVEIIVNYSEIIDGLSKEIHMVWQSLAAEGEEKTKELIKPIKKIVVSDEQLFRKKEENRTLEKGTLYIVVRFGGGPSNFGSSVAPISIYALGVANQVKPAQLLLGTFVSYWTTKYMGEGTQNEKAHVLQVWNAPEVLSNFNVVDTDFRNLYKITGNIVIGPHAIRLGVLTYFFNYYSKEAISTSQDITVSSTDLVERTDYEDVWYTLDKEYPLELPVEERDWKSIQIVDFECSDFTTLNVTFNATRGVFVVHGVAPTNQINEPIYIEYNFQKTIAEEHSEKVPFMAFQTGYHASMDSQPFGNTNGFIESEVNFSTDTFTISTYLLDNQLGRDCLALKGFRYRPNGTYTLANGKSSTLQPNNTVKVGLEFSNGFNNIPGKNEDTSDDDPVKGSDFFMRYKILDTQIKQEIADIPTLTIAFTR